MNKKYKVIETCEGIDKVVKKGDLEECKNWIRTTCYDSIGLLEQLEEDGVDLKEFIINSIYDEEVPELKKKRLKLKGLDELKERFYDSYHGYYQVITNDSKVPVIFQYGITEDE